MGLFAWQSNKTVLFLKVKVAQSYLTLCDPMDYTVHGLLQARILEWVAFPFSKGSSQSRDQQSKKTILFYFTQNSVSEFLFGTCKQRQNFSNITYLLPNTHSYVHGRQQEVINSISCLLCPKCTETEYFLNFSLCIFTYACCCVRLFATPWTVAHQALLSMGFSRQEYWSGLPFPSPEDLPDPGIELTSPALTGGFFTTASPGKPISVSSSSK